MNLREHETWVFDTRRKLAAAARKGMSSPSMQVTARDIVDMIPHYWREEASNIPEWFERTCGGLGLDCRYDLIGRKFTVSLQ